MCPKLAEGEIASMEVLMTTVLNAEVMKVFGLDLAEVRPGLRLHADLAMNPSQGAQLRAFAAEYFDGVQLEIGPETTIGDLQAQVTGA
jgi:hypothetical protein